MLINEEEFIKNAVEKIKEEVKDEKVIIALSGGVDSSVASVLAAEAIGDQLEAVFVDHGLLRKDEAQQVEDTFKDRIKNFKVIEAQDEFIEALAGVRDPEKKREIIGHKFIEVFEREAKKSGATFLLQGTIAPDWIESEGNIKSHHNLTLPDGLELKIIEPLREIYKDEVRAIGSALGLPDEIVHRQPFPGPGLAVRVLGDVTHEKLEICREANAILNKYVEEEGLDKDLWQYFVVLTDSKVTGVKGDQRDFGYLVVIRMVQSFDAMTANVPDIPWPFLHKVSQEITAKVPEITHVSLSLSNKPPSTIEFE
ncbi:MAG: glutamine-hydrolyzing GMP synthase [Methanosphaera sp.]|uniref:glutamine-hydrolyzing GMP synthase n=1 Tax=Methanosphaera sp. TaxID=2666342 RepID=UPI0025E6EB77|nr:glutamine-hydrolyzing GMP synthase [Methanosphaera sp.]MCI5867428.1 glutamine-hydrolyzing GMP synthase [Methanosphaera sp.]MDD6534504.1 glutamine-hydrolyzing GMP synthase [Methanosphaera sp.]MDY3955827.1 glutamine-hydrolyzing GMP synthase [Methanosphaera sp.]